MVFLIGIIVGIGVPMQIAVNTQLKKKLGSPIYASLVSFSVATAISLLIVAVLGWTRGVNFGILSEVPAWAWIGGFCGVFYLTANVVLFIRLGAVLTTVLPIFGQILMGVIIDQFGLFRSDPIPLSASRLAGLGLVAIGVLIVTTAKAAEKRKIHGHDPARGLDKKAFSDIWLWCIVGTISGMVSSCQTAANGYLGASMGSPYWATVISNVIGSILLVIISLILLARQRAHMAEDSAFKEARLRDRKVRYPWWIWIGGCFGQAFILTNAILSRIIGTGLTVVVVLIGITLGGILVDQFGWLRAPKNSVNARKVIGVVLMVIGAALIRLI